MDKVTNEVIKGFESYLYAQERSKNTIGKYLRDVRAFCACVGDKPLSKAEVLKYKSRLCESYAPRSVNAALSSLNALFSFMGRHELKVKTLKIQRRIFADKERELTKAEYERLLTAARNKKKLYYLMQTVCSTGIRISELRYITTSAVMCGQATINCKGKLRTIFLPRQLCKMLKGYVKENKIKNGSVFVTKSGKPLDRSYVWKMLKSLCDSAGVSRDKVFPHNLRHLFARTYYSLHKDIVRLADILGHSSVNTTRIYTMSTDDVCRRQIQKLGLLRL